jgi:hypothetical protein
LTRLSTSLRVGLLPKPSAFSPLSLGPGDVTGRGRALRVSVCVVPDECLPVLVTRPLDRVSNLLPGQCHGFSLLFSRRDQADWRQGYPPSIALRGAVWRGAD